jgi:translation initiation factor 2 alpha subunit (eIF-2alpha)
MVGKEEYKYIEKWHILNTRDKILSFERDILKMKMMLEMLENCENIYASAYSELEKAIKNNIEMLEQFKMNNYKSIKEDK